ncbi:TCF3 fusion partner-like, partial [Heterodontus francisci]
FLMKCLDSHGDDYRSAQLTILLEDEGIHGDDTLLGDNAQSALLEGEDVQASKSRPLGSQGSQGSDSPLPGEGGSAKRKRIKEEREAQSSKRHSSPFYILGHDQIKQECSDEEMSPPDVTEPLAQVWNPSSPEEKAGYSDYPSPAVYPEFD